MPRNLQGDEERIIGKLVKHYKEMLFNTARDNFAGQFDFETFHFHRNAWENALAESLVDSFCAATKEEAWPEITSMYCEKLKNQVQVISENTQELREQEVSHNSSRNIRL